MIFLLSGHCNSCGQRPTVKRVLSRSSSSRSSAKFTSIGRMDIFYVVFNGHKMYIARISTQFRTCSNSVKSALEYKGVVIISFSPPRAGYSNSCRCSPAVTTVASSCLLLTDMIRVGLFTWKALEMRALTESSPSSSHTFPNTAIRKLLS